MPVAIVHHLNTPYLLLLLFCVSMLTTPHLHADTAEQEEIIFGWHLMSRSERTQYRLHLNHLKTAIERQSFLDKHKIKMKRKAEELGIELKDETEMVEKHQPKGQSYDDGMSGRIQR